jgi:hypothetical protein
MEGTFATETLPAWRGTGFGVLASVNGIGDFLRAPASGCSGRSRRVKSLDRRGGPLLGRFLMVPPAAARRS